MADEDPFAEPDDTDKTVIRPNPGGRRPAPTAAAVPPSAAAPAPAQHGGQIYGTPSQSTGPAGGGAKRDDGANLETGMTGMNTLNACAATLFSLVSRIRNRAQHPDPDALRRSVVAELRAFESRAVQAGVDPQHVKIARYAICATLDDVVLNTPWGGESSWAQQSMVGTFHRETVGGDRFYDLLARLEQDPARNIDLLEFLYLCLALGFEGRLRIGPNGKEKHREIREGLARIIRAQRGDAETDLSPHWKGLDKPHRPLSAWKPIWIAIAAVAAVLSSSFLGLSYALSVRSEGITGQLSVLDPAGPATLERRAPPVIVPPQPPEDTQLEEVSSFLEEEIEQDIVTVFEDANTITVRIKGAGMFRPGSDSLQDKFQKPLSRVAEALDNTEGPVIVVGHSDSVPISTARFPSNMALSLARAETVRKTLAGQVDNPDRLSAEGRSDKEPIATNETAEGRAQNRRIEIVLVKQGTE